LRGKELKHPIPIENVYYLFCYAWERFSEGKAIGVGTTDSPKISNLFATVLMRGVNRLIRRGLDRGYVEIEEEIPGVRGRIDVGDTLRRNLLIFGHATCRFDDLRYDVLHNQIIKATLTRLTEVDDLDETLRQELRRLKRLFSEITDVSLSNSLFRRVQLLRNNGNYDLLIKICELVHSALLPHPDGKGSKFSDLLDDKKIMPAVFEAFIRNFLKTEQNQFSVRSSLIEWDGEALTPDSVHYLPVMRTDVTLRSKHKTIIIDAKYYPEALAEHFGQRKIISDHLYQLFAYLKNYKSQPSETSAEGILLYPTTSQSLDLAYVIGGHNLRIKTLQLNQPWQKIHADLLDLVVAEPRRANSDVLAAQLRAG
jgi:5-methylcytosine-specific restriction enzyme subunit McrC